MAFNVHIVKETRRFEIHNQLLLITGDGKTLPADLKAFLELNLPHDVACIGRSISIYPWAVKHYVDVDSDAGKWTLEKLDDLFPRANSPITHTLGAVDWVDVGWEVDGQEIESDEVLWHGSTALFAVLIGLAMRYKRIVLAGCPMDSKGHWYFPDQKEGPRWTPESYQNWFEFAATEQAANVSSMSGYTAQLLGKPCKHFFNCISKEEACRDLANTIIS